MEIHNGGNQLELSLQTAAAENQLPQLQAILNDHLNEFNQDQLCVALILACQAGHIDAATLLLKHVEDIDRKYFFYDEEQSTVRAERNALHQACQKGHLPIVKLLVEAGANPAIPIEQKDYSVLSLTIQNGHFEIAKWLLEFDSENTIFGTMLNHAFVSAAQSNHMELFELLMTKVEDIDLTVSDRERTALHQACQNGHVDILRKLITAGANIAKPTGDNSDGLCTALTLAVSNQRNDVIDELLSQGRQLFSDAQIIYAIAETVLNNNFNLIEKIYSHEVDINAVYGTLDETIMHLVVRVGESDMCQWLLEHGGDANKPNFYGVSAYQLAVIEDNRELIEIFTQFGCVPTTYLHIYAAMGNQYDVRQSVNDDNKEIIYTKDGNGNTPLHVAAKAKKINSLLWLVDFLNDPDELNSLLNSKNKSVWDIVKEDDFMFTRVNYHLNKANKKTSHKSQYDVKFKKVENNNIEFHSQSLPHQIPIVGNSIDYKKAGIWEDCHADSERENARRLTSALTCIKFTEFYQQLQETLLDFERKLAYYPKEERDYHLLTIEKTDNSTLWVANMTMPLLRKKPEAMFPYTEVYNYLIKYPKVNKLLYVDDATYSGSQLSKVVRHINHYLAEKAPHVTIYIAIPYMTSCLRKYIELDNVILCDHYQLPTLEEEGLSDFYNYPAFKCKTLTFFEHKVAVDYSCPASILLEGKTLSGNKGIKFIQTAPPPYKREYQQFLQDVMASDPAFG